MDETTGMARLEQRMLQLEKRHRSMQSAVVALCLCATLPWLYAPLPQQSIGIVKARELQLVVGDSVYVSLKPIALQAPTGAQQGVGLFYRSVGRAFTFMATPQGGDLRVYDGRGAVAASVKSDSTGGSFALFSSDSANKMVVNG